MTINLRTLRTGIRTMYSDTGDAAGRMRYDHLSTVVRLTPVAMVANMGNASLVLWSFQGSLTAGLLTWWAIMMTLATVALASWAKFWRRRSTRVSCRGIHRSTWHAAVLGLVWGCLPVAWFGEASHSQQLVIATLFTGMMGAGTFVLGALPLASLAYVLIFTASAIWALARAGEPQIMAIAILVVLYAVMVLVGGISYWRKATALLLSQDEAVRHEQMLAVMLQDFEQSATDALWEVDVHGHLRQPSARLANLLHTQPDQLQGAPLTQWLQQKAGPECNGVAQALAKAAPFHNVAVVLEHAGQLYHLTIQGKPLFDELGQAAGWRGVISDRTAVARAQEQLHRQANTDSLTQLANRFALHAAIAKQLQVSPPTGALLLLDLDHFKTVNDSFGHSVGDALLTSVAERLQQHAPPNSLVARLGGDEFAVLLPHNETDAGKTQAQALAAQLVAALSRPHQISERRLRVGASVGIADLDGEVTEVDELLVRADIALYDAKSQGRGRAAEYTRALRERTRRRARVEEGLRQAVRNDELSLHWQPKVELSTWKITGTEALLRWESPQLGKVSPGEFIPVAEQEGLMDLIGLWALRHACECGQNQLTGVLVSVNVSPVQLRDPQFVPMVQSVLGSTGLPADRLELEITESVFIEDTDIALQQLHALQALGVRVALDDFGTGYSSLSYLCRFPFSTLKIDRSFVEEAMVRPEALAVVHHIAQLARSLNMRTVCEGVETSEQLAMVIAAGIDEVQGYLLSPPRPLEFFSTFAQDWDTQLAPLEYLPQRSRPARPTPSGAPAHPSI